MRLLRQTSIFLQLHKKLNCRSYLKEFFFKYLERVVVSSNMTGKFEIARSYARKTYIPDILLIYESFRSFAHVKSQHQLFRFYQTKYNPFFRRSFFCPNMCKLYPLKQITLNALGNIKTNLKLLYSFRNSVTKSLN